MYENIGSKIKGLAKTLFIIEAIVGVISGIVIASTVWDGVVIGILVMVVAPILAWASSLVLYGFGELIDKVCEIERNTRVEGIKSEPREEINSKAQVDSKKTDIENSLKMLEDARNFEIITEEEYQSMRADIIGNL